MYNVNETGWAQLTCGAVTQQLDSGCGSRCDTLHLHVFPWPLRVLVSGVMVTGAGGAHVKQSDIFRPRGGQCCFNPAATASGYQDQVSLKDTSLCSVTCTTAAWEQRQR